MNDGVVTHIFKCLSIVWAIFLVGCAGQEQIGELNPFFPGGDQTPPTGQGEDEVSYWNGDGLLGRPAIVIDIENQRAYFSKGGQIVGVSVVSTGREGHDTPPGNFHVVDKDIDHASS